MSLLALDRGAVRRSFERAAPDYDRHAVLQREVEQRLLERLEFVRQEPAVVLDVGCGTGRGSGALKQRFGTAQVISLDWSPAMLRAARARMPDAAARPLCADMHALPLADRSVDLVFSNLAMQWSDRVGELLTTLRRVLKPGGLVMLSSFGPGTLHELRDAWLQVDAHTHVNQFMDMHDLGDAMLRAGFREPVIDVDQLVLEYPDVISLMRELKGIGAQNRARDRHRGLTGKSRLAAMMQAYESHRREGYYPASYEVVYALAFGPEEGQPVRGPEGEWAAIPVGSIPTRRREDKP